MRNRIAFLVLTAFMLSLSALAQSSAVVSVDFTYRQLDDTHILLDPDIVGFTERSGDLSVTYAWKVDNVTVSKERAPMVELDYDGKLYDTFNISFEVCDSFNCTVAQKDVTVYRETWLTVIAIVIGIVLLVVVASGARRIRRRRG